MPTAVFSPPCFGVGVLFVAKVSVRASGAVNVNVIVILGGWSTRFLTRGGMPVTMCRLNLVKGLGAALQIAEGYTVDLSGHVHDALDQRTNLIWPTTWFAPRLTGSGANLISQASMLRIPVYMHNVAAEKMFRPRSWAAFARRTWRARIIALARISARSTLEPCCGGGSK